MHQLAVFGNPIAHSLSPQLHQFFAQITGININYQPLLGGEQIVDQVRDFFNQGGLGANITAPYKKQIIPLAHKLSERVQITGSANTLMIKDGTIYADNTDGVGFMSDLRRLGFLQDRQRVLILGAGGASYAIAYDLLKAGQEIFIYNRTLAKAVKLQQNFAGVGKVHCINFDEIDRLSCDLIINATSLGHSGSAIALSKKALGNANIYDLQYHLKRPTPFIAHALSLNPHLLCADGLGMLVFQGARSFELWFNTTLVFDLNHAIDHIKKSLPSSKRGCKH